jgi:hypothetical protein
VFLYEPESQDYAPGLAVRVRPGVGFCGASACQVRRQAVVQG